MSEGCSAYIILAQAYLRPRLLSRTQAMAIPPPPDSGPKVQRDDYTYSDPRFFAVCRASAHAQETPKKLNKAIFSFVTVINPFKHNHWCTEHTKQTHLPSPSPALADTPPPSLGVVVLLQTTQRTSAIALYTPL